MGLGSLTYEVPGARRWNTFVAGLGIDVATVLLMITAATRIVDRVLPQSSVNTYRFWNWLSKS